MRPGGKRTRVISTKGTRPWNVGHFSGKTKFEVCFDPLKLSHSFIQNCCWITLKVSYHEGCKTFVSKMEGKTNFSRRLKQSDGLTWLTPTPLFCDISTPLHGNYCIIAAIYNSRYNTTPRRSNDQTIITKQDPFKSPVVLKYHIMLNSKHSKYS